MSSSEKYSEEKISEHEERCKKLGLESALRLIHNGEVDTEQNTIKVNLPNTIEKFESGNGEGIWCTTLTKEDLNIYDSEEPGVEFKVVLLNHAISYPLPWGSIIQVKNMQKDHRPILSKDWMNKVIETATAGKENLESILK